MPDILDSEKSYLTSHIITAARIVFAKHWKEPRTPQIDVVTDKILETAEMDILSDWLDAKKKKRPSENCIHGYKVDRTVD